MGATAWRILISRKLSVYLLIVIALVLILGSTLPDPALLTRAQTAALRKDNPVLYVLSAYLGLRVFSRSWVFLGLIAFLVASIYACTLRRLSKPHGGEMSPRVLAGFRAKRSLEVQGDARTVAARVRSSLERKRWAVDSLPHGRERLVAGWKGAYGFWGSIVFHMSFVVIAAGVLVSALTGFSADLVLTEGQTAVLGRETLATIHQPLFPAKIPRLPITLRDFSALYEKDRYATDYRAELVVGAGKDARGATVGVNQPTDVGGFQVLVTRYGFAPLFRIRQASSGRAIMDRYVNLVVFTPKKTDSFKVEGTPWTVSARFFPDFGRRGRRVFSKSSVPRNPVFALELKDGPRTLYRGLVEVGSQAKLGPVIVSFDELRYWAAFQMTSDNGAPLLFAGIFAGLVGLGARFLDPDRRIYVRITPGGTCSRVDVGGKDVQSPSFMDDEIERLVVMLESERKQPEVEKCHEPV